MTKIFLQIRITLIDFSLFPEFEKVQLRRDLASLCHIRAIEEVPAANKAVVYSRNFFDNILIYYMQGKG